MSQIPRSRPQKMSLYSMPKSPGSVSRTYSYRHRSAVLLLAFVVLMTGLALLLAFG